MTIFYSSGSQWPFKLVMVLFLSFLSMQLFAQEKSNKGREFWLGFMSHVEGTSAGMSLYITSDTNTSGTVSVPGQSWSANFTVTANTMTVVTIPSSVAYINCSDCIQNKAVKITSLSDVIVYAHHYEGDKSDATLVLPTRTQGKEYYAMAYAQSSIGNEGRSEFIVVAHKDSTVVNITPGVDLKSKTGGTLAAGTTYTIILDAGEVYQGQAKQGTSTYDVTGTHIEVIDTGMTANCRTVAVFSGSTYTQIGGCTSGWGVNSGDNLFEQMYPTTSWGKQFVIVPALGRVSDNFRFLASEDNTQIVVYKYGGSPDIFYLDAGEFAELQNVDATRGVNATKPIMVAQFQKTSKCDGNNVVGDPSMTILNPLEQNLKNITLYSSQYYDIDNHYINIVIPTYAANTFRLDGNPVSFSPVLGYTNYSYARVQVNKGNHQLSAAAGFIATAYGEGNYESYGYAAGANVKDFQATIKVTNSPLQTEVSGCLGTPTMFQGDAAYEVVRWEWHFGDGSSDTNKNTSHTYADTGTYIAKLYTYKPQFDGCSNYDSALVEISIYGVPTAKLWTASLCENTQAEFRDSSSFPAPESYITSKWKINDGEFLYGQKTKVFFDTAGTFQFQMVTYSNHQCTDTISDSIVISPQPVPKFLAERTCYYDSTLIINQSSVSSGSIDQNIWEFSDGDSSLKQHPSHYFQDSGYHTIKLFIITDSGCSNGLTDTIYKMPKFYASFTFNDTCFGFASMFKNTSYIEGSNFTDTVWYTSEMDTFHTFDMQKTFEDPGTHTVQLIMEQDTFCKDTFEQDIVIHNLAIPNFMEEHLCVNDSVIFTDLSTFTGGTYSRHWDLGSGISSTDSIAYRTYNTNSTKEVKLTITTEDNCQTFVNKSIVISDPGINAILADDVCRFEDQWVSAATDVDLDSFLTYTWLLDGVQVSSSDGFNYSSAIEGHKIVELLINTRNGCKLYEIDSFLIHKSPLAAFTVNPVCNSMNIVPVNESAIDAPYTLPVFEWYINGTYSSSGKNPQLPPQNAGFVNIKLVAISDKGCRDSVLKQLEIHADPQVDFLYQFQCLGEQTAFSDNSVVPSGTGHTYAWTLDGQSSSQLNFTHRFPTHGNHDVKLVVKTADGCKDSITKAVPIYPLPELDISLKDYEGCVPFKVEIQNNSSIASGTINQYAWNWGNGETSNGAIQTHTYIVTGSYVIKVIAGSEFGCKDSVSLPTSLVVHPSPTADFSYSPEEINAIVTEVLFRDLSTSDVIDWHWNLEGLDFYTQDLSHHFADSGYYPVQLIVTNTEGCKDTVLQFVPVNSALYVYVPTGFSPNDDGLNDLFGLGGITNGVTDLEFFVYNRWGEQIFFSNHPDDKWDGTYLGTPVRDGVYIYLCKYSDPKRTRLYYLNGTITITR